MEAGEYVSVPLRTVMVGGRGRGRRRVSILLSRRDRKDLVTAQDPSLRRDGSVKEPPVHQKTRRGRLL